MSYIENLLEKRKLPPILPEGTEKLTLETWEKRRLEILDLLSSEEYGYAPDAPEKFDIEVVSEKAKAYAGKGYMRTLKMTFETDNGPFSFPFTEIVPLNKKNVPTFVNVNFRPQIPDDYLPCEEILDGGCAVCTFYYNDISEDKKDDFTSGLATMYDRKKYTWGKLRMWAWIMSRIIDYLYTQDYPDFSRIATVGHSRLGKTSLVAAAYDTRIAMACPNDSGCSGDAITRDKKGERIVHITRSFPYWFCENYQKYIGNEHGMPFDQHFLCAAVAPRKISAGAAYEDEWADPESQYLSLCAASEVWEKLGFEGFSHPDRMCETGDVFNYGDLKFHLRKGPHYFSREDWQRYIYDLAFDTVYWGEHYN